MYPTISKFIHTFHMVEFHIVGYTYPTICKFISTICKSKLHILRADFPRNRIIGHPSLESSLDVLYEITIWLTWRRHISISLESLQILSRRVFRPVSQGERFRPGKPNARADMVAPYINTCRAHSICCAT